VYTTFNDEKFLDISRKGIIKKIKDLRENAFEGI